MLERGRENPGSQGEQGGGSRREGTRQLEKKVVQAPCLATYQQPVPANKPGLNRTTGDRRQEEEPRSRRTPGGRGGDDGDGNAETSNDPKLRAMPRRLP